MTEADRRILGEQQAQVVNALAGASTPDGFDARQLGVAARALHYKRARGVAKSWPALVSELGPRFDELFGVYAASHAIPNDGADSRDFAEWLLREGRLGDGGRIELVTDRARNGWPVRMVRLCDAGRVVIAIRVFGLGVRRVSVPIPRGR